MVVAATLAAAPRADAHATLVTTNPANDAVLAAPPARVVLRFDEAVATTSDSLRVLDEDAQRVEVGKPTRPRGDTVAVELPPKLGRGTYTVAWSVVSADTHPVHGAFVFSVGAAAANPEAVASRVLRGQQTPAAVTWGFGVVRFLSYVLLFLAGGGAVALAALGLADRRLPVGLAGAALLFVPVSLAGIALQAEEASTSVRATVDSRFGVVWLVRAGLAVALAVLARRRLPALALGLALLATGALAGHAAARGGVTLAVDLVHVLAAGVWSGGLAFVVAALALARTGRWELAGRVVPRFSALALGTVSLLLAAGIANAYLEVRSWHGLVDTLYGRLVLAKAALLVPVLALAAYNRRYAVPRRRFLRSATAELVLVAAVVGVTAALVVEPPPKAVAAPRGPFAQTAQLGPYELNLVVDPARTGWNAVHVYLLKPSGLPAAATEATIAASLADPAIGPIRLRTDPAGPGHFVASAQLPIAGDWLLRVEVRRGQFDQWGSTLTIPIRKGR